MSGFYTHHAFRWYVIYSHPKQGDRVDLNLMVGVWKPSIRN